MKIQAQREFHPSRKLCANSSASKPNANALMQISRNTPYKRDICTERVGSQCTYVRCDEYTRMTVRATSTGIEHRLYVCTCAPLECRGKLSVSIDGVCTSRKQVAGQRPFEATSRLSLPYDLQPGKGKAFALSPARKRVTRVVFFVTLDRRICEYRLCV